jgi:hypothetical protein
MAVSAMICAFMGHIYDHNEAPVRSVSTHLPAVLPLTDIASCHSCCTR